MRAFINCRIFLFATFAAFVGCATPTEQLRPVSNQAPTKAVGVFDVGEVDSVPRAVHKSPPYYPVDLRRAGVTGETLILFTVQADGSVTDTVVLSANDIGFGEAACAAIRNWRYTPAVLRGKSVACRITQPMSFSLAQ